MTKKHFIALAAAIATLPAPDDRKRMCQLIGEVCKQTNPLFDWVRWKRACNVS